MGRWTKALILVAIGIGLIALLRIILMDQKTGQATMANSGVTAEALEHEIRGTLPLGSSLFTVQDFLSKRGIEFSFEASSKSVYAVARKLKGSTTVASKSLSLQFHFDDASNLKSIDTKVLYTGP
jgi:hypothetical protein